MRWELRVASDRIYALELSLGARPSNAMADVWVGTLAEIKGVLDRPDGTLDEVRSLIDTCIAELKGLASVLPPPAGRG